MLERLYPIIVDFIIGANRQTSNLPPRRVSLLVNPFQSFPTIIPLAPQLPLKNVVGLIWEKDVDATKNQSCTYYVPTFLET